ncbi:unnamed protein product [Schistosoma turkestanicum]|nr:unnamed protein product [Schistosoma turkestanicum]
MGRCQFAMNSARGCPAGPLSACQQLNKVITHVQKSNPSINSSSNVISASCRKVSNQNFLESQTQLALSFGSSNEYRYWLTRWFRQLIEDNEEERVRQIIQDLIGPVSGTNKLHSTLQSEIKGISRHILAKELLSLFALNLHLQRLYVELNEMLNEFR